jgi:hypothetical protein
VFNGSLVIGSIWSAMNWRSAGDNDCTISRDFGERLMHNASKTKTPIPTGMMMLKT